MYSEMFDDIHPLDQRDKLFFMAMEKHVQYTLIYGESETKEICIYHPKEP
ncbi:hypothetical protein KDK_72940 [Dictyobacter kobayashii]|uniref:Uncharacterized protein n=1 Tax=Dictyobacter kobayashii TaxID=2014872 RepID=A0A402AWR6_9CHLR|nr:hypothetical protein KDK_72940 [Dictyobacter kobayashii]